MYEYQYKYLNNSVVVVQIFVTKTQNTKKKK